MTEVVSTVSVKRRVHKFGGSSLADARCYWRVAELIAQQTIAGDLVIVSAAGKTTQYLLDCLAAAGTPQVENCFARVADYQRQLYRETLDDAPNEGALAVLDDELATLHHALQQPLADTQHAALLAFGECWSARLLAERLNQQQVVAQWWDARDFLRAGSGPQPEVDLLRSAELVAPLLDSAQQCRTVITGFIAQNARRQPITLGRNGSDYSASVIAVLTHAEELTIWTDVAGIYSADPRWVEQARPWPVITQREAQWLAHLGSPVLHTRTLEPLLDQNICLSIRSSLAPEQPGTQIVPKTPAQPPRTIVTAVPNVELLTVPDDMEQPLSALLQYHQLLPLVCQRNATGYQLCFTQEVAQRAWSVLTVGQEQNCQRRCCVLVAVVTDREMTLPTITAFHALLPETALLFSEALVENNGYLAVLEKTVDNLSIQQQLYQALVESKRTDIANLQ